MLRFFRLVLLLIGISCTMLLVARLGGAISGPGPLAALMTGPTGVACDHPCLFGIRPGVTTVQQATLMLHAHSLTHDAKWLDANTLQLSTPDTYVGFSATSNGLVDSITLSDNMDDTGLAMPGSLADSATLGDVVLAFGFSNVGLPGSAYFVLGVPAQGIVAASARPINLHTHVPADTPLSMIMVSVYRPCPTDGYYDEVYPWKGFTTILNYMVYAKSYNVLSRSSGVFLPPDAACQELSTPAAP